MLRAAVLVERARRVHGARGARPRGRHGARVCARRACAAVAAPGRRAHRSLLTGSPASLILAESIQFFNISVFH